MLTLAQWIARLTKGYIKFTGKKPDKLAQLKIKMEAGQKVKDQKKVIEFPQDRITDWTKERPEPGMFDNIFAKMQKDMGKKPTVVKTADKNFIPMRADQYKDVFGKSPDLKITESQIKSKLEGLNKKTIERIKRKRYEAAQKAER